MAIGGFGTVRGYPLAEAAGDDGFAVSAEYVVPFPFEVPLTDHPKMKNLDQVLSFYGFIDHGHVFVKNKQPGERDREFTGAGAGLRFNIPRLDPDYPILNFTFAVGFPVFGETPPADLMEAMRDFKGEAEQLTLIIDMPFPADAKPGDAREQLLSILSVTWAA